MMVNKTQNDLESGHRVLVGHNKPEFKFGGIFEVTILKVLSIYNIPTWKSLTTQNKEVNF